MESGGPLAFVADSFKVQPCLGPEKFFKDLSSWELLNLQSKDILDIPERLYGQYHMSPGKLLQLSRKTLQRICTS